MNLFNEIERVNKEIYGDSMKKYKAKLYYNMVEEVEVEAEDEVEAREKAYSMGGEGKTHTFFDFIEVEENETN